MANWKKMAEAFGKFRETRGPNRNPYKVEEDYLIPGEPIATITQKGDLLDRAQYGGSRRDKDVDAAWMRGIEKAKKERRLDRMNQQLDGASIEKPNELQDDFDAMFEEAVARRKGNSGINRSYLETRGLSPDEIDQIDTDENRRILIDLLKKNSDTGDVLRNFGED